MKPLCVSFVEKDPKWAEQVLAHLESAGIQGLHCEHAEDLPKHHAQQTIDVVILDAETLGDQSLTMAGQLAKHPELRVIMISPEAEPQERIAAIAAGADACISKPFNPVELVTIIQRLASRLTRALTSSWTIDPVRALLTGPANNAIGLTAMETVLLTQLALAPEQALRSDALKWPSGGFQTFTTTSACKCVSHAFAKSSPTGMVQKNCWPPAGAPPISLCRACTLRPKDSFS